jgi:CBS domain containing-hemolysin-like protein
MTPRPDIFSVPLTITWTDLLTQAREQGYSRVPVYDGDFDNIVGTLLIKDLLRYRKRPLSTPKQLRSILLPPSFVPASKPADDLLREFMQRKMHQAIVVDEHGTMVGLVSLDDLLSELVGDLLDIDDEVVDTVRHASPGVLSVQGDLDIDDFEDETGITLPEGEYHTVGGFVFHELGRLPRAGDSITHEDHLFQVSGMDGRRVTQVHVSAVAP